jgi:hypothetical protein
MKLKSFLLAVFSVFVLVSVAKADGVPTVDQFVLSDGSSAVMFGLNQWFLSGSQTIAAQPGGSYLLTFPMRFADGFLNFGMQITASGNDSSIRFGCLDVLVYPEDPDPGYGEAVCQSVGGTRNVQDYTDQFSDSFFSVSKWSGHIHSRCLRAIPAFHRTGCHPDDYIRRSTGRYARAIRWLVAAHRVPWFCDFANV